jgi:Amiloride-sensitive sodium channel
MVALVHDNTQLPSIEAYGLLLRAGERHKLGYRKKTTFLLPDPYTSCTDKVTPSMNIMFDTYYDKAAYGYSQTTCYQLCEQTYR